MSDESGRREVEASPGDSPHEMSVNYVKSESFSTEPVTGARGGSQPSGGYKYDFLFDFREAPTQDVYRAPDVESTFELQERKGGTDIQRMLQFGIFANEQTVRDIAILMLSDVLEVEAAEIAGVLDDKFEEFHNPMDE
jgi:hypothetical protein